MADVSVRPARAAESAQIARIQRDTLAMAYERLLTPEVFGQLADPEVQQELAEQIRAEIVRPSGRVLVAMEGEKIVGFSFVRAAVLDGESSLEPGDTDVEHTGFLEQMLVEPRFGRRGHGSRLLAASIDYFTTAGFVRAVTWLPEENEASVNFLNAAGWARDGYTRGFDANGTTVREIRLHTAL